MKAIVERAVGDRKRHRDENRRSGQWPPPPQHLKVNPGGLVKQKAVTVEIDRREKRSVVK